jgi:hypothetical protein
MNGWWFVAAVLELPNNARRSFSLSVCSGLEVMEWARRRLIRGYRRGLLGRGKYGPGIVVMIGKEVVEWREEFFWQRRVIRVINSTGLSWGLLRRQKRQQR